MSIHGSLATTSIQSASQNTSEIHTYFESFPSYKKAENWQAIIELGERALADGRGIDSENALIHAQLASCYFYLGNYEKTESHATSCNALSSSLQQPNLLIRSFYLLSAHKRAQAGQSADLENQKALFCEARKWIDQALQMLKQSRNPFLRAKVYFNAGAVEADDPSGKVSQAILLYEQAMDIFQKQDKVDDYHRTVIRLAKAYLRIGHPDTAMRHIDRIKAQVEPTRTFVHLLYVEAQILLSLNQREEAVNAAKIALEQADSLKMETDIERLRVFLKNA